MFTQCPKCEEDTFEILQENGVESGSCVNNDCHYRYEMNFSAANAARGE